MKKTKEKSTDARIRLFVQLLDSKKNNQLTKAYVAMKKSSLINSNSHAE